MPAAQTFDGRDREAGLTQKSHWNHCAITAILKTNKWRQVFNEFGDTVAEERNAAGV
jgi:hypothetical protein